MARPLPLLLPACLHAMSRCGQALHTAVAGTVKSAVVEAAPGRASSVADTLTAVSVATGGGMQVMVQPFVLLCWAGPLQHVSSGQQGGGGELQVCQWQWVAAVCMCG